MRQKEYLLILGSTLVIIVLYVIFNVYHNYTTSTIDNSQDITIVPIDGSFDQNTINQIKNRKRVSALQNIVVTPIASPTPTLELSPTPIASPSPTESPTP